MLSKETQFVENKRYPKMDRLGGERMKENRSVSRILAMTHYLDPACDFTLLDLSFVGKDSIFF